MASHGAHRDGAQAKWGQRLLQEIVRTFRGLTARRFAVFLLVLLVVAISKPSLISLVLQGADATAILWGIFRPFAYATFNFGCVLLAVMVVENRGATQGWRRIAQLAAAAVIGQTLGYVTFLGLVNSFDPHNPAFGWVRSRGEPIELVMRLGAGMLFDLTLSLAGVAFWYLLRRDLDAREALREAQMSREAAQRASAEARFAMMQAQIEPHFLFNTLASIRRLYEMDGRAGRTMLRHLSRYLAVSLPALREARSTLGRELVLVQAYLGVQRIRMGARLKVTVDVAGSLNAIEMPPMMLATLVENAVLHGLTPLPAGGEIRIAARADGKELVVEVE